MEKVLRRVWLLACMAAIAPFWFAIDILVAAVNCARDFADTVRERW